MKLNTLLVGVDCTDRRGDTPLIYASRNGMLDCVKFLIRQGADPNQRGYNKWTALLWASLNGRHHVVQCK
jgi:ankyrin repeat protein